MDVESLISPHIEALETYQPPDWEAMAARAGLAPDQLVRLDANENPYGPSPRASQALARFQGYGFYPDYAALGAAVAHYAGVDPGNVVLGSGGDEIIDLAVRLFVEPGQGVIVCPPAFGIYTTSTLAHRGRVLHVPRLADFSLDVAAIEALVAGKAVLGEGAGQAQPKLLFVTTPGNPDGLAIPAETIRRLLDLPLAVVVDEAYVEFGGQSVVPLLDEHPNLLVLRTFSKWAGMAGLRLGYALVSPLVAQAMARLRPPYNVNAAAVVAALATFEDMDQVRANLASMVSERQRLYAALVDLPGVQPLPSQANFLFCRLSGRSGRELAHRLARQGILLRSFTDPTLADALRISIGRPEQNDAVIATLWSELKADDAAPPGSVATALGRSAAPVQAGRQVVRCGSVERKTAETELSVNLDLDGTGRYQVDTGLGFLDHMLAQLASHGLFDLEVQARGDLEVDEHHTVEDVAIGLGQALDEALDDRRGLVRMGQAYAPLDEALAHIVVDLSGRPYAVIDVQFATSAIGAVGTDLIIHFLETLAFQACISLHARVLYGRNDHHKAEALFKALARALDAATRLDPRRQGIPSTKGVL
jgi:histidinol-phosphate aminotransferase